VKLLFHTEEQGLVIPNFVLKYDGKSNFLYKSKPFFGKRASVSKHLF